jgi:hypothetical protein
MLRLLLRLCVLLQAPPMLQSLLMLRSLLALLRRRYGGRVRRALLLSRLRLPLRLLLLWPSLTLLAAPQLSQSPPSPTLGPPSLFSP